MRELLPAGILEPSLHLRSDKLLFHKLMQRLEKENQTKFSWEMTKTCIRRTSDTVTHSTRYLWKSSIFHKVQVLMRWVNLTEEKSWWKVSSWHETNWKSFNSCWKKQPACLTSCGSTQRLSPSKPHHCLYSISDLWTTQCTIASLTFLLWGNPWEARTKNEHWLIATVTVEIIGLLNRLCFWIVWAQRGVTLSSCAAPARETLAFWEEASL